MKNQITIIALLVSICAKAQVGVGTTSPNSTLDVRGSMSTNYRAFSSATSAATTDNILVFTGTSAATLTLPDATACTGRAYNIKNVSSNASTLTIATTSSQTIDGIASWTLTQTNKAIILISNGANWYATSESLPGNSAGTPWIHGGNNTSSLQNIGTTSNFALPFITNNTEKMRLTTSGNLGIGTSTFDATNPEKLLVDAGSTSSFNVISGKGTINNYLQLNIQNKSTGNAASSDVVATADNGNETVNYVDIGINSSGYASGGILGGANRVYMYGTGNDFVIGNSTSNKDMMFFTGGTATTNERMRITAGGDVGVGVTNPTNQLVVRDTMEIRRVGTVSELLFTNTSGTGDFRIGSDGEDIFWQGGGGRNLQMGSFWTTILAGDRQASSFPSYVSGTGGTGVLVLSQRDASVPLAIQANSATQSANLTEWRNSSGTVMDVVDEGGSVAIGTSTFDASNPERLLVDAGTTSSFNVISGKGTINNYLQLNIQNKSSGSAASSDVVATANNGTESVNFVDMGINSSGYSASGILGGSNNAYLYATGNDFIIGNASTNKDLVFFTGGTATTNERMRITNSSVYPGQDNSYTLGKSGNRWSAVWSANGTIQTSDIRTKKNIHALPYGLNEIMQLKPVAYNWKNDPSNQNKIGLIAQQVRTLVPEVVVGNEQTETLGMNYAELVPVLVKAIQEQQQQIDELKTEVKRLKRKK